nr:nucleotide-binding alpha-beta plait domain-containing protein [Tanacetum cinerariifolium]
MGSYRSKEDDVTRISTSIYVTNFPESFSAKDLFNTCKIYGHVVDSYIPFKKSKAGKRFGFVWFINVFNEERFQRPSKKDNINQDKQDNGSKRNSSFAFKKDVDMKAAGKSFAQAITGNYHSRPLENEPAIVLDDGCLLNKPLDNSLLGRVKEIASLSNLRKALGNEGFDNFKLHYMGEFWVLIEFDSANSKKLFHENTGARSWFSQLKDASPDFHVDGRIKILVFTLRDCLFSKVGFNIFENFKINFRGKVYWIRAKEVPGWVPDFSDDLDEDDYVADSKDGEFQPRDLGN